MIFNCFDGKQIADDFFAFFDLVKSMKDGEKFHFSFVKNKVMFDLSGRKYKESGRPSDCVFRLSGGKNESLLCRLNKQGIDVDGVLGSIAFTLESLLEYPWDEELDEILPLTVFLRGFGSFTLRRGSGDV